MRRCGSTRWSTPPSERYPAIDDLRARLLAEDGVDSEIRPVAYRFKRGAVEVLVLKPPEDER